MKIRSVRAEFFHADGRKDERIGRHDEATSCFSQFWERAKLVSILYKDSIHSSQGTQGAPI
jgi:hypothetical protein